MLLLFLVYALQLKCVGFSLFSNTTNMILKAENEDNCCFFVSDESLQSSLEAELQRKHGFSLEYKPASLGCITRKASLSQFIEVKTLNLKQKPIFVYFFHKDGTCDEINVILAFAGESEYKDVYGTFNSFFGPGSNAVIFQPPTFSIEKSGPSFSINFKNNPKNILRGVFLYYGLACYIVIKEGEMCVDDSHVSLSENKSENKEIWRKILFTYDTIVVSVYEDNTLGFSKMRNDFSGEKKQE